MSCCRELLLILPQGTHIVALLINRKFEKKFVFLILFFRDVNIYSCNTYSFVVNFLSSFISEKYFIWLYVKFRTVRTTSKS